MRIAYDHQIFGWQVYGGISRYFYELARRVSLTTGYEATVVAPFYVNQYLHNRPQALRVVGRQVPPLPRSGRIYRTVNSIFVGNLLANLDPRIVHETYYSRRRLAPKQSKVVLTVFDMVHEKFRDNYSFLDPTRGEKAAAVARADHVICISKNTQRDLIDILGVPPEKTSVVYLASTIEPPGAKAEGTPERPFLLYVGFRGGYKNFKGLLAAYSKSPMLMREFDLVCFGGGAFTREESRRISEFKIPSVQIRQLSGSDRLLATLYAGAAVFVYPSVYEGFGIPPLEAMSVGCPVVCCNASSLPEVVGNAAQLFDPLDATGLASAIELVVTSAARRKELVDLGRERCALFSWERTTRETLALYDKLGLEKG